MRRPDDPELGSWLKKASEDMRAATVLQAHAPQLEGIISFHYQQAAEKFLKAVYVASDGEPARTHDLDLLLAGLLAMFPELSSIRDFATFLKGFAIVPRYPVFVDPPLTVGDQSTRARQSAEAIEAAVGAILRTSPG